MKQSATLAHLSKKAVAFAAAATTLLAGLTLGTAVTPEAQASTATRDSYADTVGNPTFEAARKKYGLPKDMKDGATLHAFEWSFKTIMENIPDIAKAGYTSIQTEPIVKIKDNRKLGTGNWVENWYYVYQPTDMSIGNYVVGSEDEFKEMCKMAHQYGLRIIVDSVSNHFTSDFDVIEGKWKNKSYFHTGENISDYNNREDCTQHKLSGLWDLNTQDDTVAQGMADLLKQTVADGADGFRYDAAKHIELSDEVFGGKQSHYWDTILKNGAQYQYGEVLADSNVRENDYANLFSNSSIGGGGVTDSNFGHEVRNGVQNKNLGANYFIKHNFAADKSVDWVESHDNFSNQEASIPAQLNDEWIKYGWAGISAQNGGMTLFFDRPYRDGGDYGTGKKGTYAQGSAAFNENSKLGDAGSDLWKDPEVVAVNHFRNAMVGEDSNVSNCGNDNCLMVERYAGSAAQDGMVVANANGAEKSLAGQSTKLANGTYTDEVTGSTITVSGGKVVSGSVKAKSIAAFSNKTRSGKVSTAEAYPNKGTIPGTSKKITLRSYQATDTTYTTSDGQSGSYKDGDVIKIGSTAKSGQVITVTVKGTGADGEAIKHTYSYTKHGDPTYDPNDGTQSPCDKYCMQYMDKNGYDPDKYIDAEEPNYEGGEDATVTSLKISGDTSMDLSTTQSLQLKASVTTDPANSRVTVNWSSSDESLATVDKTGKVTGLKAGTVKITAKAGDKSDTITLTLTGVAPVAKNVIYAEKPSGWSDMYAYVYTGDGATAVNNAAWPGVKMEKADNCDQTGYKYVVPDNLAKGAKVIFNDGGSQQYPGSREPGLDYGGGIVKWDGSSAALTTLKCDTTIPVTSVSISGSGVAGGKLSLETGATAQLSATVNPSNATDRTVAWSSSNTAVATVDKTGKVTGVKAGTATITATAGDKSASVQLTVTAPNETVDIMFKATDVTLKSGETLYAVGDWGQAKPWTRAGGVRLAKSGSAYTGTASVARGHAMAFRLIKVGADGKTTWDPAKDRKATADQSKTLEVTWDGRAVSQTVDITINAAADLKSGETLYAVGDWGQANAWSRAAGVKLAKNGDVYSGVISVKTGHAMAFRLIKVDASGKTTWDPASDRKATADKTKAIGVAWSVSTVNENGVPPVTLAITGDGVSNGKLTLSAGSLAQLAVSGTSSKVDMWWSDGAAVAVSGTGTVYAVQKGTAKVNAKVDGKTLSLTVTVQ